MMKTAAPPRDESNIQNKKPRTSVAILKYGPVDNFVLLAAKIKCEQLRPGGTTIHTINKNQTVAILFRTLIQNNILSLPVTNNKGKYYGSVNMLDIVTLVCQLFENWKNFSIKDLETLFQQESKFTKTLVGDIMSHPVKKQTPFHPVHTGMSLFTVWEILAKEELHRVPVIARGEETVQDIITQSMMIDFLWQNINQIGTAANTKVSQFEPPLVALFTVNQSSKVIEAFREMMNYNVSGLAVVDNAGKLVDNISMRDLRGLGWEPSSFWRLWYNVTDFKSRLKDETRFVPEKPVVVTANSTMGEVIEHMASKHIHRVFVVDDVKTMVPTRVITQTDVLKQLLKLEPIYPAV